MTSDTAAGLESVIEKFSWFQLAWLLYAKNLKQLDSPLFNSALKKAAVQVSSRKVLFQFLNTETRLHTYTPPAVEAYSLDEEAAGESIEPQKNDSLIDQFLVAGDTGRLRQPLVDQPSMADTAGAVLEKSTTENDEMITETLAGIYFQQKKLDKALHAYQKLSLKYPEKSTYFASRIKEIKDLLPNS